MSSSSMLDANYSSDIGHATLASSLGLGFVEDAVLTRSKGKRTLRAPGAKAGDVHHMVAQINDIQ